jgi:hypothetical protein
MADPITAAIVGSLIGSIVDGGGAPTKVEPMVAMVRAIPEDSKVGQMSPPVQGQVYIDGKAYPLSPGAQIRNELNMIILPTMVQEPVKVRYVTDILGAVQRVWILSSTEARLSVNN